ncbi:MAG: HEAT repeat domain-containing protein [Terracidiphilus sp.]
MTGSSMKISITAFLLFAFTTTLPAQQPKVSDTQFKAEPVEQNLAVTVDRVRHSNDQLWLGYEVPALPGAHLTTCSDWSDSSQSEDGCCGEYRLEDERGTHNSSNGNVAQNVYILLRFDKGDLVKIRAVAAGCHLNAGGISFDWITGVNPEESIAFLARLVNQPSEHSRTIEGALLAISFHAAPEATRTLEQIASSSASEHTREQAAFWLGVQRGHDGFVALKSLENKNTDNARFREKLAFDFSLNSDPGAQDELLHMAKFDPDTKVRGQALFWIAQKAGKRATAALTDAIQNDPETDVKKKAVFALSQLPKDESVPQLIHVADTNSNLTVRKEAFFWLGQSQDPRALAYLEQVLKK